MNLKPYPKYKDSGIEWLGKVPEGWEVKRLKYLLKSLESGSRESQEQEFNDVDKIPSIGGEHISWSGNIEFTDNKFISKKYFLRLKKGKIKTGDVLLVKDGATIGKTAFVKNKINAAINEHVFILRTSNNFKDSLLYYNIVSDLTQDLINLFSRGAAQAGLPSDFVSNIFLLIPPEPEQTVIANFLDQKTSRIDELIKKNERLIELLKEKRQAVISQAVTKGLDPNAKMKDSGIEWIGEVPEGWEVKRLKWAARLEYGSSLSEEAREEGSVPVFGSNGIVGEHSKSITDKPAIIIGRKGSYGKVSYSDVPCFPIDTTYYIDSSLTRENIRWLYYLLGSIALDEITFDTGVPGLSREFAYAKIVPVPSKNDQTACANFLDQKTAEIDETIQNIQSQIAVLKEYRQALISNVVTGKVKVA